MNKQDQTNNIFTKMSDWLILKLISLLIKQAKFTAVVHKHFLHYKLWDLSALTETDSETKTDTALNNTRLADNSQL